MSPQEHPKPPEKWNTSATGPQHVPSPPSPSSVQEALHGVLERPLLGALRPWFVFSSIAELVGSSSRICSSCLLWRAMLSRSCPIPGRKREKLLAKVQALGTAAPGQEGKARESLPREDAVPAASAAPAAAP